MTPEYPREPEPCRRGPARGRVDRGTTYIELLISLVLIGTALIAILTAVRATTIATRIDEQQTTAFTALLTAADEVYHALPASCSPLTPAAYYDGEITDAQIQVTAVDYLGRASAGASLTWGGGACAPARAHRLTLVYRLDGEIIETYQTVKRA